MQSAEMICISSRSTTGDSTGVCHEGGAEWEFGFCEEERERGFLGVLLLGVEGHSEALSDGVRCGLSLVALELALCTDVLGEVLPRYGRLKPRLKGRLAKVVSFKWYVKIATVEDSELR
ncbi:hypothetical protein F2Q69_00028228 [Brassica cretica]|uniref:Uncharacterized protein n=1 Tax=Brassica cretica TaxID=69181 RepID=A0A8S9RX31_BRACR|nr:hypothetical protein F2Q69_00028228 [Brassica cretica]